MIFEESHSIMTLKSSAETHLKQLEQSGQAIQSFQSNVNVFISRYGLICSYLDRFALMHGNMSWWLKAGLWITALGTSASIGFVLNALIAFPIVVFITLVTISILLSNHYNKLTEKETNLTQHIKSLESSLEESVIHLSSVETQLRLVFGSLYNLNINQAEHMIRLQEQINQFSQEVESLAEFVKNTNELGERFKKQGYVLSASQDEIIQQTDRLAVATKHLEKCTNEVSDSALNINQKTELISKIKLEMDDHHHELAELLSQLHHFSEKLQGLVGSLPDCHDEESQHNDDETSLEIDVLLCQCDLNEDFREKKHQDMMQNFKKSQEETQVLVIQSEQVRLNTLPFICSNLLSQ